MAHSEEFHRTPDRVEQRAWVSEEYEAGYQARLQEIAEFKTATPCWRAGWQDAHRELTVCGGPLLSKHIEQDSIPEQWSLYGTGQDARLCELPFDENREESWKRSWIQADIALGLKARRRRT